MSEQPSQLLYPAAAVTIVAFVLVVSTGGPAVMGSPLALVAGALALAALISIWHPTWQLLLTGVASHGAAILLIAALPDVAGRAELGFWCLVVSAWLTAWAFVQSIWALRAREEAAQSLIAAAAAFFFVLWVLVLWELVVRGMANPETLPPAPSEFFGSLASSGAAVPGAVV